MVIAFPRLPPEMSRTPQQNVKVPVKRAAVWRISSSSKVGLFRLISLYVKININCENCNGATTTED